jgi:hypothetical protein
MSALHGMCLALPLEHLSKNRARCDRIEAVLWQAKKMMPFEQAKDLLNLSLPHEQSKLGICLRSLMA